MIRLACSGLDGWRRGSHLREVLALLRAGRALLPGLCQRNCGHRLVSTEADAAVPLLQRLGLLHGQTDLGRRVPGVARVAAQVDAPVRTCGISSDRLSNESPDHKWDVGAAYCATGAAAAGAGAAAAGGASAARGRLGGGRLSGGGLRSFSVLHLLCRASAVRPVPARPTPHGRMSHSEHTTEREAS